jgi:hypothetical protein
LSKLLLVRSFLFPLLLMASLLRASGQNGALDPAFEKIDLNQWLAQPHQAHFHFKVSVPRAELSFHQRLVSRVEIELDGRDLENRRGPGQLVFFTQVTDSAGVRYQSHESIDLSKLDENIKAVTLDYSQRAFFVPGEYQFAAAILDTATGDHAARQSAFHIDPLPRDPLSDSWRNLPPVEFIPKADSPDNWYLPAIQGRLQSRITLPAPPRIDVILNVAPSIPVRGTRPTPNSGFAALLPTLKVLTQMRPPELSENVELLDLARRRAVFQQNAIQDLDWAALKQSLGEANTASIDVHSLSDRHHDAQFFVSTVRKLLRSPQAPSVLVVLTTAVAFESGEDLEPVSLESMPSCPVVYIRYRTARLIANPFDQARRGRGARLGHNRPFERPGEDVIDQLQATLKPLNPKVFDVESPEQMRHAIAEIQRIVAAASHP